MAEGEPILQGKLNKGEERTTIAVEGPDGSGPDAGLLVSNAGNGDGLVGHAASEGFSSGVVGQTFGGFAGVQGLTSDIRPDTRNRADKSGGAAVVGVSELTAVLGISGEGPGVRGAGVLGTGVEAVSKAGVGLQAHSETDNAVRASKGDRSSVLDAPPEAAIWGDCKDAEGVIGTSESVGVRGLSAAGTGVSGQSTSGSGITGRCAGGTGVKGEGLIGVAGISGGEAGIGVVADGRGATALDVRGKATFRRSGIATIEGSDQNPSNGVNVLLDGLTKESFVLATLQSNQVDLFVRCAFVFGIGGKTGIQILLNRQTSVPVNVAWFVIN